MGVTERECRVCAVQGQDSVQSQLLGAASLTEQIKELTDVCMFYQREGGRCRNKTLKIFLQQNVMTSQIAANAECETEADASCLGEPSGPVMSDGL